MATKNPISLGQTVLDAKSNAITAIPKLLEILEFSGALITIDAMGCPTEIAAKIIDNEADYCLAVKGNQPTLHDGIIDFVKDRHEDDFARHSARIHDTYAKGDGREEGRRDVICPLKKNSPMRFAITCSVNICRVGNSRRRCANIGASRTISTGSWT